MRTPLAPGRRGPLLASALGLAIGLAVAAPARAEPLPSGSLGVMFGAGGGTGKYARTLGLGYYQFGAQAAWQPMTTERRIGWSLKWSFVFGTMYGADSARIDLYLRTLQMDFLAGLRIRPGESRLRYLALRGGLELLRSNEPIQPDGGRAFVGPVADAALEQYAFGAMLFNVDVRYGLIGAGPAEIALLVGASISVP
ncbi:MAG: hypothetical protein E6J90_40195 [Deltaproteobacteria bacterium]|nr:MAG: hypothetical protein E6J90_40195 [Deltaproteobacteria bacterium]TMQ14599.1 MAG: hypothetical protein E6J91_14970 [Deltaproteobacteria bacterium]